MALRDSNDDGDRRICGELLGSTVAIMEVTYTTTVDDFVACHRHVLKRRTPFNWPFWGVWLLVPLGCVHWIVFHRTGYPEHTFYASTAAILWLLLYPLCHRVGHDHHVSEYARLLEQHGTIGPITLLLDEETLTERNPVVEARARWKTMYELDDLGDVTYVYVTGVYTAIIPRHGFQRPEEYESVRTYIRERFAARTRSPE
jgi:hypothetical protein